MALVSVLLPYRQAQATLAEALCSVLDQRGVDLEVLAIDDGSIDDGPRLVRDLAARDPRIVPLPTGGVGIARALTAGLASSRGRWIARMDADDVTLPGRLAAQVELLAADDTLGLVATQVEAFPEHAIGEGMRRYVDWQNRIVSRQDHERELFVESPVCHPSVVLRRDALERAGAWRAFEGPEDYDLWLRLHAAGWGMQKVPEVLLRWRRSQGAATTVDPRYAIERFTETKARYLAAWLLERSRPIAVWGAGSTGKRLARALERHGVSARLFVDIDPLKIGRTARGAPIARPESLRRGECLVVVAVGARGARDLVRGWLVERGFDEGTDFVCAA